MVHQFRELLMQEGGAGLACLALKYMQGGLLKRMTAYSPVASIDGC
jgi:hypothetical protein